MKNESIHIQEWKKMVKAPAAVYAWGKLPSAVKKDAAPQKRETRRSFKYRPQPVSRHPHDVMFFGPAYVGLGAELRGMA